MICKQFKDLRLSMLGFGTMRLPLVPGGGTQDIDQAELDRMVDLAIAGGVNYFDTAAARRSPSGSRLPAIPARASSSPTSFPATRTSGA